MIAVSVVMPVYNAERYLEEAIESILCQSFKDFEFIIINDGSYDKSGEIINKYLLQDNRIVVCTQKNMGIVKALNNGISISRGKYIARMDADDIALNNRLAIQYDEMEKDVDLVVCGTAYYEMKDNVYKEVYMPLDYKSCRSMLYIKSCFAHPTVMIRADILKKNNIEYREEYSWAEDYKMWSEISHYGKIKNINIPLLKYRMHDGQVSVVKMITQKKVHYKISSENLSELKIYVDETKYLKIFWPKYFSDYNPLDYIVFCFLNNQCLKKLYCVNDRYIKKEIASIIIMNIFVLIKKSIHTHMVV